jgi:hypothetical protein
MDSCKTREEYERWIDRLRGEPLTEEEQEQLRDFLWERRQWHINLDYMQLES